MNHVLIYNLGPKDLGNKINAGRRKEAVLVLALVLAGYAHPSIA